MIRNNDEPKPNPYGTDAHDEQFEGSCALYAEHLVEAHGFAEKDVEPFKFAGDSSAWSALNTLHRTARALEWEFES